MSMNPSHLLAFTSTGCSEFVIRNDNVQEGIQVESLVLHDLHGYCSLFCTTLSLSIRHYQMSRSDH